MSVAIFWVLFAVAVGIFASNRGRNGFGWFLLSLVISPLLGLIFCAVSKNLNVKPGELAPSAQTHRRCPACAEFVLPQAVICKHCRSPLPVEDQSITRQIAARKNAEADEQTKLIMGIVCVVALLVAVGMISR